ncbi:MAG: hypothetical protein PHV74_10550 [Dehalococcoidia bacterium]|nr:hypothetical protein [Dehalococcoidia bacterium]
MFTISSPHGVNADSIAAAISNSGWGDAAEVAGVSCGAVLAILIILFMVMSIVAVVLRKLGPGQNPEENPPEENQK